MLKDRYAYKGAEFSRSIVGDEATARVESWYLALQDRVDRTKFSLFGGDTNPFEGSNRRSRWLSKSRARWRRRGRSSK